MKENNYKHVYVCKKCGTNLPNSYSFCGECGGSAMEVINSKTRNYEFNSAEQNEVVDNLSNKNENKNIKKFFDVSFKNYGNSWFAPKVIGGLATIFCLYRIRNSIFRFSFELLPLWGALFILSFALYVIGAWMNYKICMLDYVGIKNFSEFKKVGKEMYDELWDKMNEGERIQMNGILNSKMELEQVAYTYYFKKNKEWPNFSIF